MPIDLTELQNKLYTADEAAGILGVTPAAVRRLIRLGVLKASRPPRRQGYMVRGEDLIAYLTTDAPVPSERYTGRK